MEGLYVIVQIKSIPHFGDRCCVQNNFFFENKREFQIHMSNKQTKKVDYSRTFMRYIDRLTFVSQLAGCTVHGVSTI